MQHTKTRRFQPQARLEPAQQHWWQARKAHVLTITTRLIVSLAEVINRRKPGCREKNPVRRAPENAVHWKLSVCTGPTLWTLSSTGGRCSLEKQTRCSWHHTSLLLTSHTVHRLYTPGTPHITTVNATHGTQAVHTRDTTRHYCWCVTSHTIHRLYTPGTPHITTVGV